MILQLEPEKPSLLLMPSLSKKLRLLGASDDRVPGYSVERVFDLNITAMYLVKLKNRILSINYEVLAKVAISGNVFFGRDLLHVNFQRTGIYLGFYICYVNYELSLSEMASN